MSSFNESYSGTPPWDIGRPQPAFVALGRSGVVRGSVLDAGCGTGENGLYFAEQGHEVWGIDSAPAAIEKARAKAESRGIAVRFLVHDALALQDLGRTFDSVIDSGLFHVFGDEDRAHYVHSLMSVLPSGGRLFMMCFSDRQPGNWGPRRITQAEIRVAFAAGWRVDEVHEALFEINQIGEAVGHTVQAWLASITRL
jgi:cyclopropane fatty-acyl-phospholipid synthase-like methyltransferase